jgi:preprotein translocase subunit YajC
MTISTALILLEAGDAADMGELAPNLFMNLVLPLIFMVGLFYFLLIRPESKRKKQAKSMLENIQIADEVVTAGGIIGRVVDIKPDSDTVVIETGGNRTRIRILKSYIVENKTVHDD